MGSMLPYIAAYMDPMGIYWTYFANFWINLKLTVFRCSFRVLLGCRGFWLRAGSKNQREHVTPLRNTWEHQTRVKANVRQKFNLSNVEDGSSLMWATLPLTTSIWGMVHTIHYWVYHILTGLKHDDSRLSPKRPCLSTFRMPACSRLFNVQGKRLRKELTEAGNCYGWWCGWVSRWSCLSSLVPPFGIIMSTTMKMGMVNKPPSQKWCWFGDGLWIWVYHGFCGL